MDPDPVADPDPYYISKIQKSCSIQYFIIYIDLLTIQKYIFNGPKNAQVEFELVMKWSPGSGTETNTYGSTTLLLAKP
jgi:hypothetical protein